MDDNSPLVIGTKRILDMVDKHINDCLLSYGCNKLEMECKIGSAKELLDSLIKFYTFEDPNAMVPSVSIKDHLENLKELLD